MAITQGKRATKAITQGDPPCTFYLVWARAGLVKIKKKDATKVLAQGEHTNKAFA